MIGTRDAGRWGNCQVAAIQIESSHYRAVWCVCQRGPDGRLAPGGVWGEILVAWMKVIATRARIRPRRDG